MKVERWEGVGVPTRRAFDRNSAFMGHDRINQNYPLCPRVSAQTLHKLSREIPPRLSSVCQIEREERKKKFEVCFCARSDAFSTPHLVIPLMYGPIFQGMHCLFSQLYSYGLFSWNRFHFPSQEERKVKLEGVG